MYNRRSIGEDFGTCTIHLYWCTVDCGDKDCFAHIRQYLPIDSNLLDIDNRSIRITERTNASALVISLESFIAWPELSIVFDVLGIGCCCIKPHIISTTVWLLCVRLLWMIWCMDIRTFRCCCTCCRGWCRRCCGVSWPLTSEWSFCITTFVWFCAVMATQCTLVIVCGQRVIKYPNFNCKVIQTINCYSTLASIYRSCIKDFLFWTWKTANSMNRKLPILRLFQNLRILYCYDLLIWNCVFLCFTMTVIYAMNYSVWWGKVFFLEMRSSRITFT